MKTTQMNFKEYVSSKVQKEVKKEEGEIEIVPALELSPKEQDIYENFGLYMEGKRGSLDLSKGINLTGGVGLGKTMMFRMAQHYQGTLNKFKMVNALKLEELYESGESLNPYYRGEWCFDDIGTEQEAKHYGKNIEVFKRVIENRYELWKYHGVRTHFTTNLIGADFEERYGERAYDRVREMCNYVKYPASESKRGTSAVISFSDHAPKRFEERDFETEEREKIRKNDQSLKKQITEAYKRYSETGKRNGILLHEWCYFLLDLNDFITANGETKREAIAEAIQEKKKSLDDKPEKEVVKIMSTYSPYKDARIITIFNEFDNWLMEDLMYEDIHKKIHSLPIRDYKP